MNNQNPNTNDALSTEVVGLVERGIEAEAGVPLSQMTPVQVVEAMVAASSAPVRASGKNRTVAAPALPRLTETISDDPIFQDRQVRMMATAEMQRLRALLDQPAQLTLAQLLNGQLSGS